METKKTVPQKAAPKKVAEKNSAPKPELDIDLLQRDFEYMIALYRDKKYKPAKEPRYCEFSYAEISDFLSTIPPDGSLRIYYGQHFQSKDLGTPGNSMIRSSTNNADYVNCHTLILCKVDKDGNDILEITRDKKQSFLVAGGKSPMDGGSLCPPSNPGKALLMTNADKDYPNT